MNQSYGRTLSRLFQSKSLSAKMLGGTIALIFLSHLSFKFSINLTCQSGDDSKKLQLQPGKLYLLSLLPHSIRELSMRLKSPKRLRY